MVVDRLHRFFRLMKNPLMKKIEFKANKKQNMLLLLRSFTLVTDGTHKYGVYLRKRLVASLGSYRCKESSRDKLKDFSFKIDLSTPFPQIRHFPPKQYRKKQVTALIDSYLSIDSDVVCDKRNVVPKNAFRPNRNRVTEESSRE